MTCLPQSPVGPALLNVDGLTKAFAGVKAVDNLSFTVSRGGVVGLIGPNGSGKSTSIDCITGFTPADSGTVFFDGHDISRLTPDAIARAGAVRTFQNVRVYDRLPLIENLAIARQEFDHVSWTESLMGSQNVIDRERAARERGLAFLELVGLAHYADAPASTLSYGQKKLLSLAMTLMPEPKLVILDEPLAGVNPSVVRRISSLIDELNGQGQTFLIIEHNVGFIMRHCHVVIVMEEGAKLAEGPATLIREDERVLKAYLGSSNALEMELVYHAR